MRTDPNKEAEASSVVQAVDEDVIECAGTHGRVDDMWAVRQKQRGAHDGGWTIGTGCDCRV